MTSYVLPLIAIFLVQLSFFLYAYIKQTDKVTDLAYGITFVGIVLWKLLANNTFFPVQILIASLVTNWGVRLAIYLFIRIHVMKRDKRFDEMRGNFFRFAS